MATSGRYGAEGAFAAAHRPQRAGPQEVEQLFQFHFLGTASHPRSHRIAFFDRDRKFLEKKGAIPLPWYVVFLKNGNCLRKTGFSTGAGRCSRLTGRSPLPGL